MKNNKIKYQTDIIRLKTCQTKTALRKGGISSYKLNTAKHTLVSIFYTN